MTDNNYQFRINVTQSDSHVHFDLFVAPEPNRTYVQTGTLVMRREEFAEFARRLMDQGEPLFSTRFEDQVQQLMGGIYHR